MEHRFVDLAHDQLSRLFKHLFDLIFTQLALVQHRPNHVLKRLNQVAHPDVIRAGSDDLADFFFVGHARPQKVRHIFHAVVSVVRVLMRPLVLELDRRHVSKHELARLRDCSLLVLVLHSAAFLNFNELELAIAVVRDLLVLQTKFARLSILESFVKIVDQS